MWKPLLFYDGGIKEGLRKGIAVKGSSCHGEIVKSCNVFGSIFHLASLGWALSFEAMQFVHKSLSSNKLKSKGW